MTTTADILDAAIDIAWHAGRHTLAYFQTGVGVETKDDLTPVTRADREAEELMRRMIEHRFPDHGILGEEFGEKEGKAAVRWILDPIDGTKTFIRGVPLYGTLIGVEVEGEPAVGVIYMPALDELVSAGRGLGCRHNGRLCRVSDVDSLEKAMLLTYSQTEAAKLPGVNHIVEQTQLQRTWGDCYAYVLVATGRGDVAIDPHMALWDCAPLMTIIEEAGGTFTDIEGQRTIAGGSAVATNGRLHDAVLKTLAAGK